MQPVCHNREFGMKKNRDFEIAYVGLKPGLHHFKYLIDDSFFDNFAKPEFHSCKIDIELDFDKKSNLFVLHFTINGKVITACDRCSDDFELSVWDEHDVVIKLVEPELVNNDNNEDPDVVHFPRTESILDISEWIYEGIILSLPIQKIHPEDAQGTSTCNPKILQILKEMEMEQQKQTTNTTNPIWEGLNKLKNK